MGGGDQLARGHEHLHGGLWSQRTSGQQGSSHARLNHLLETAAQTERAKTRHSVDSIQLPRVVTGSGLDGRGMVLAAILRFPTRAGSPIDKFRAGEIAAAVDLETGKLGQATDLGLSAKRAWHARHPVTGRQIEGLRVPDWPAIVDLAKTAHNKMADRVILGWEIAPLSDGPCIIAANAHPDLDVYQRTMRAPLGNDRLGQLMAYHLVRLKDQR